MKTLINNLITIYRNAITAGDVSAVIVYKGFKDSPEQLVAEKNPYIAIDEGGERVEEINANTQMRYYSVLIEFALLSYDREKALDNILTLSDEIKTEFEKLTNRQLDGHTWGVNIQPMSQDIDDKSYLRGRLVTVEYHQLEDREYNPY